MGLDNGNHKSQWTSVGETRLLQFYFWVKKGFRVLPLPLWSMINIYSSGQNKVPIT